MEATQIHTRWMIRRDMPEVMDIEERSFPHPWSEKEFIDALRVRNNIGMVVELEDEVVGYMVYGLHKTHLDLINLAVRPDLRRTGIGTEMIDVLKKEIRGHQTRRWLMSTVWERNLEAQLFLKSQGWLAKLPIVKDAFEEGEGDAYLFRWRNDD